MNIYYILNINNLCRIIFYTPSIVFSGLFGSILYDYITYKKNNDNSNDDNKKKN